MLFARLRSKRLASASAMAALVIFGSPALVRAEWSDDTENNTAIADRTSEQVVPKVAITPSGASLVAWFDLAAGSYDVYLQRLDFFGDEEFPHNGLLVSDHPQNTSLVDWDLISDQFDNAVLAFTDTRNGSDLDVYAYKISPSGTFDWGANGIALSSNNDFEPSPSVCEASDGDFVFVWPRLPDTGDGSLRMQRVAPDGTLRYLAGGIDIVTAVGESPAFCRVIPSTNGSVIVGYVRDIDTFSAPRHVRAVKIAANGSLVWGPVAVFDAAPVPIGYQPQVFADGSGGAIFCFHRSQSNLYNSVVQRLNSAGAEVFAHNGITVSTDATRYHLNPTACFSQATQEIFVFWNEEPTNQSQFGISMQKITSAGARGWGNTGLSLVPMSSHAIAPPRSSCPNVPPFGEAMVFFADEPTGIFGKQRALAYRVNGGGGVAWGPLEVATHLSTKSRLPIGVNYQGDVTLVWEDDRSGQADVYGQLVNVLGGLTTLWIDDVADDNAVLAGLGAGSPNPFERETWIPTRAAIELLDATGRRVRMLVPGGAAGGGAPEPGVRWDGRDRDGRPVPAGVYFYRRADGVPGARRITLIR